MRRCSKCGLWKPPASFPPRARVCHECIEARRRLWRRFEGAGLEVHDGLGWVVNRPKRYGPAA